MKIEKKCYERSFIFICICLIIIGCTSCAVPIYTENNNIVPIYVIDKRNVEGDIKISLQKPYLSGDGEAQQHMEIHYVSPDIAKKLSENPELLKSLLEK